MREVIARIEEISQIVGDDTSFALAEELAGQMRRAELNLLVVGQFKRGKSTLVNALLGDDVMPTGALPITGVVTAIRYGEDASIDVRLRREQAPRRIALDELALYASEHFNPGNSLGVERIDVSWPSQRVRGFVLFDTPGTGSTFEHNTLTARAALPRADAAILVVGPEPPIGAQELQYASEVLASSEKLFIVLNKSDLAGDALPEVLDFTERTLQRIVTEAQKIEILPISATRARAAQREGREDEAFGRFTLALHQFLNDQGELMRERSARRRAMAIVNRLDALLAMRVEALSLPRVERQRRKVLVEHALEAIGDRVRALELLVDDDIRHMVELLQEDVTRGDDRDRLTVRAQSLALSKEPSSRRRAERLEGFIGEKARTWRAEAVQRADRELRAYATKYARLLAELEIAAFQAGCEALHVDGSAFEPNHIEFASPKLELIASLMPTTGIELILSFAMGALPALLREPLLRRRFERVLTTELDALRGKLRHGIAREVEPWRRSTHASIASSVESTRQAVLRAFQELMTDNVVDAENAELERVCSLRRELSAERAQLNNHALAS